jgi:hypothetical protein
MTTAITQAAVVFGRHRTRDHAAIIGRARRIDFDRLGYERNAPVDCMSHPIDPGAARAIVSRQRSMRHAALAINARATRDPVGRPRKSQM